MSIPGGSDELDEPIDGADLLGELHAAFGKYVVFPSPEAHDAVVVWCAATHAQDAWEHAPRLALVSPEKRCGKSRVLDVAEAVCYMPMTTVNTSPAAIVRSIPEADPPTLMLDEADTVFGTKKAAENNEDLRGIINAGYQRNRRYTRWDMAARSREELPTFAMAALAAIKDLPDTIMDRAVVLRMRRRGPGEVVSPFRTRRDAPPLHALRGNLNVWIRGHLDDLQAAVPALPVEDRAADTWEPLFAIAELAGADWPARCEKACLALTGEETDDGGLGVQLLTDLKEIWPEREAHLFTSTILERLHGIEGSPWNEWGRRREPITAYGLATLLREYRVKPRTVRIGEATAKGYVRVHMADPLTRYVTPDTTSQEGENDAPTSANARDGSVTSNDFETDTGSDKGKQSGCDGVTAVTAGVPKSGKRRPEYGTCAGCNERMTITEPGQTTHPGCEAS